MTSQSRAPVWLAGAAVVVVSCAHVEGATVTAHHAPGLPALLLRNASRETLCYVRIEGARDDDADAIARLARVDDALDPAETILPGASRGFDLAAGRYDLLVQDCNRDAVVLREGLAVDADHGVTVTIEQRE